MKKYNGSCHCGSIKFTAISDINVSAQCNCSLCIRRGTTMVRCHKDDLEIISGKESLSLYQFNTKVAEHYFCRHCGVYTFHKMRKLPDKYGVNAGCLDGINPFDLTPILTDGAKV